MNNTSTLATEPTTAGWPPAATAALTAALAFMLPQHGTILESGVQEPKIAYALAARAIQVVRLNLCQHPAHPPLSMKVTGQPETFPFAAASFGGVYTINAAKSITDPHQTVAEVRRVLEPNGLYINGIHYEVASDISNSMTVGWEIILKRNTIAKQKEPQIRLRLAFETALRESGASVETVQICRWSESFSPRQSLKTIAAQADRWKTSAELFEQCLHDYERWLKAQYADLDTRLDRIREITIQIWRWQ
ncbi:MAG: methyltransferase domain-containing protein [Chloroflexota bacterium]